jgi:hypothetical protein
MVAACGGGETPRRVPEPAPYFGQAVWLTYFSPEHARYGRRHDRVKKKALHLAQRLRREVLAGSDIGQVAREWSNAPGGIADGITPKLPLDAGRPGPRAKALSAVAIGEVTEVVEWLGGYWFAKRIDVRRAAQLEKRFNLLARDRASFRAIALVYRGAWIANPEVARQVKRSKEEAIRLAETFLQRALDGEDFAALAREHSEDKASAQHGGLITLPVPEPGWEHYVRRVEPGVPEAVLGVVFEDPPGTVHPGVVVTRRGVFVVKTEDRKIKKDQ